MSYTNLWDKFKEVRVHYRETRKIVDEFIVFLRDKSELDRTYARGLEKLTQSSFFELEKGTLDPGLAFLQQHLLNQVSLYKGLANQFHVDLALALRQLLVHQDLLIKENKDYGKKLVQEREKLIKIALKAKEKYYKAGKDAEISTQNRNKFEFALKQEEEFARAYHTSIESSNNFAYEFKEGMDKILTTYQLHEEERMKLLKESLLRMLEYEKSFLASLQESLDTMQLVSFI